MKIGGVIVAGGRSSRMGQEKALLGLRGRPVVQWIIDRLAPQVGSLTINANGDTVRFDDFGLPVMADELAVGTPLAGLHAALRWAAAQELDAALTVPSDSPFLPKDLAARLAGPGAAVAASGDHTHYLTGLWPTALLSLLEEALSTSECWHPASLPAKKSGTPAFAGVTEKGKREDHKGIVRVQDWVSLCNARIVEWPVRPYDPFFNVNTPADLAEAGRIAAEFDP